MTMLKLTLPPERRPHPSLYIERRYFGALLLVAVWLGFWLGFGAFMLVRS